MGAFGSEAFSGEAFSVDPEPVAREAASASATDHTAVALARLPHQYRIKCDGSGGETNTQKVIRILTVPANPLAAAIRAVIAQRNVETATGVWLTQLGALVGREREGVTDDEIYRRYVKAQIATNKSDGLIEDIITIATLVVGNEDAAIVVDNTGAAAYILRIDGVPISDEVAAVLIELAIKATGAGVRVILGYTSAEPSAGDLWGSGSWGISSWRRVIDEEI